MKVKNTLCFNNVKVGVGLRHPHFSYIEENLSHLKIDFFEAITENFLSTKGRPFRILCKIREQFPIALHGVSLSIASSEKIDWDYVKKCKTLYDEIDPCLVSDHLCWTGSSAHNLHNLLPFAYTKESFDLIAGKIEEVQNYLKRPLLFENLSAYFTLKNSDFSEVEFLNRLCDRTGCGLLVDINNIYVNSINQKFQASNLLNEINLKHVRQIHLAGHEDFGDYLFDTHSRPVIKEVWHLFSDFMMKMQILKQSETQVIMPRVLLEWDEDIPEFPVLEAEAGKIFSLLAGLEE